MTGEPGRRADRPAGPAGCRCAVRRTGPASSSTRRWGSTDALLVPVRLEPGALRAQARAGMLPPLLRGLVKAPARTADPNGAGSLVQRLAAAPRAQWQQIALDLVRGQVAAVLGHASGEAVDPDGSFSELGFDSLGAVELAQPAHPGQRPDGYPPR